MYTGFETFKMVYYKIFSYFKLTLNQYVQVPSRPPPPVVGEDEGGGRR
jgi:hypothetical protein